MSKRLIYEEDAIDALMEILDRPNHAEFLYTDEICRALNHLPSAQPKHTETHECVYQRTETHDWIPVTERLPDEWKRVLIQNDEGLFLIGFTKDRGWGKEWFYQYEMYDYDAYIESEQGKIIAWMPLPEPLKGETNE